MRTLITLSLLFFGFSCATLEYKDDIGFLVSAQADSPEYPIYLNGHLCVDSEGIPGFCAKRIKSNEDVSIHIDAQTYAYLLTVTCTNGIGPVAPISVPSGQKLDFTIPKDSFSAFKSFTCIGEVSPQDRSQPLSGKWEFRVKIVDAAYVQRERIYLAKNDGKWGLVLGQYARSAWVFDNGKWSQHSKDTIVEISGDPAKVKAYSESYAMRFNYFNMGDADPGIR